MDGNVPLVLPFMIGVGGDAKAVVPIGDAILTLPIARENGFKLFLPPGFSADLIEPLTDVPIVRDFDKQARWIWPAKEVVSPEAPYSVSKWGTKEFMEKFGRLNATECWAAAVGLKLENPAPSLKRPRGPEKLRAVVFPSGSVPKRSMGQLLTDLVCAALRKRGLEPCVCPRFKEPSRLAAFVASAEYAVGVYTGPTHLAAAMGIKTVAIPIGDSPWAYRPLQRNAYVLAPPCDRCWTVDRKNGSSACGEEPPLCVRSIRSQHVLDALDSLDAGQGGVLEIQA